MVQKSILSNLVTEFGNAKIGHQIRHCQIWSPDCTLSKLVEVATSSRALPITSYCD